MEIELSGLAADIASVDLLARLQLAARRLGGRVLLRSVPGDLVELIALAGLAETLPVVSTTVDSQEVG